MMAQPGCGSAFPLEPSTPQVRSPPGSALRWALATSRTSRCETAPTLRTWRCYAGELVALASRLQLAHPACRCCCCLLACPGYCRDRANLSVAWRLSGAPSMATPSAGKRLRLLPPSTFLPGELSEPPSLDSCSEQADWKAYCLALSHMAIGACPASSHCADAMAGPLLLPLLPLLPLLQQPP